MARDARASLDTVTHKGNNRSDRTRDRERHHGPAVTRRGFLRCALSTTGVMLLAACTPAPSAPPSAPSEAPKPTAGSATGAATPTAAAKPAVVPTSAPAKTGPVSVTPGKTFVFARAGDAVTLDPPLTTENESERSVVHICEGLFQQSPDGKQLEPGLAERVETSADGRVRTYHLRKGVKFHDGTDFDAESIVFNFDRWRFENNPYHQGNFNVWRATMGGYPGAMLDAKAVDQHTVQVTLEKPMGPFDSYLANAAYSLTSPTAVKADPGNIFKKPVGTGPFKFVEWVPSDRIVLERNTDYWGPQPNFDRVIMRVIPDPTARFLELRSGTIDVMDDPNPDDIALAQADPNLTTFPRDYWPVGTININFEVKPLDNLKVRWAMAHAIDREGLMPLYGGQAVPGNQDQTPASWAYNPDLPPIEYNPTKAKQLLAEAGYPDGFSTTLWYMPIGRPYFPNPKEIAQKMGDDLTKVGIKVDLQTEDWGAYLKNRGGKYPLWMLGGWASTTDPSWLIYQHWGAKDPLQGNYDNAEVRDLMNRAQFSLDQNQRAAWYRQVAKIVYDEMAIIPIVFARAGVLLARKRVQGYPASVLRQESFKHVVLGD